MLAEDQEHAFIKVACQDTQQCLKTCIDLCTVYTYTIGTALASWSNLVLVQQYVLAGVHPALYATYHTETQSLTHDTFCNMQYETS